jgi:hypothetical protein
MPKSRYNQENYKVHKELYIVTMIKVGRFRWMGQLFRQQEQSPCRKLPLHEAERTRRVGRPVLRGLVPIEEYSKIMSFRNWRRNSQNRNID